MTQMAERQTRKRENFAPDQAKKIVPSQKWVRVYFGGKFIADSKNVILVRQGGGRITYYFPAQDIHSEYLQENDHRRELEGLGEAAYFTVIVGDKTADNAAWKISQAQPEASQLEGYFAFKWKMMDAWFEEDEEVFVHPRDPYTRLDVIQSSRHVRVVVGGETVAETDRPVLLFETGLPVRYYIPKVDVRLDLLQPTKTHTECPYKGIASYYSARVGDQVAEDIAWYYPFPLPEVGKIQNLIAFYDEKVDAVYVDGEKQERPKTPWS
jgi:uncharacterized protein (DUF427 family)